MSVHWWMAAGYVLLFVGGNAMTHVPEDFPIKGGMYEFHNTVGVTSIALLTWRILTLLRVWGKKYLKRLPKFSPKWYLNTVLHTVMYVFMWMVPVSGVFLTNAYQACPSEDFVLFYSQIFSRKTRRSWVMLAIGTFCWPILFCVRSLFILCCNGKW